MRHCLERRNLASAATWKKYRAILAQPDTQCVRERGAHPISSDCSKGSGIIVLRSRTPRRPTGGLESLDLFVYSMDDTACVAFIRSFQLYTLMRAEIQ